MSMIIFWRQLQQNSVLQALHTMNWHSKFYEIENKDCFYLIQYFSSEIELFSCLKWLLKLGVILVMF